MMKLDMVGIEPRHASKMPAELSGGMVKRIALARALALEPEMVLFDEPTSGLDPQNARQIRDLVRELQQSRQVTTVISSHNLAEIQELCDRVAILDHGKLVIAGSVQEITRQGHRIEVTTSRPFVESDRALLRTVAVSTIEELGPQRYRLQLALPDGKSADDAVIAVMRAILDLGIAPRALTEGNSLEEYFLSVTGEPNDVTHRTAR
jgi:ABC-type multidrug transport system ATPase subunit